MSEFTSDQMAHLEAFQRLLDNRGLLQELIGEGQVSKAVAVASVTGAGLLLCDLGRLGAMDFDVFMASSFKLSVQLMRCIEPEPGHTDALVKLLFSGGDQ